MKSLTINQTTFGQGKVKICVPIISKDIYEIEKEVDDLIGLPIDVIEWRIDYFNHYQNYEKVSKILQMIKHALPHQVILVTFRTLNEGGNQSISKQDYFKLYEFIASHHLADLIDVEIFNDLECDRIINMIHHYGVHVIGSYHNFEFTESTTEIIQRLSYMQKLNCDLLKVAMMPNCTKDVLNVLEATYKANDQLDCPIITMSMGKMGLISRISGQSFGSCMTFASAKQASAPGQINVQAMNTVLNIIHNNGMND